MKNTPFEKIIPISQLLLDTQNPRLPEIQENQHDAIRSMASTQGEKIIALAEHLVDYGPNPASIPIVMSSDENGFYSVLDGNRRVTTLKLLESPSLAEGILEGKKLQKLKHLSTRFIKSPITELNCIVVADRDEADKWILLIHRGQQQGAGLVEWDGQVAARYDVRKNSKPHKALEILDYAREYASLSEKTRQRIDNGKFPITNLERLINTPYVRKKLGLDIAQDGRLVIAYPEEEVLKGLSRVIEDLGTGEVTVSRIKSQEQRIDYINGLSKENLPDTDQVLNVPRLFGAPPNNSSDSKVNTGPKPRSKNYNRTTLIPRDCKLNVTHHRINSIYKELKQFNIDDFPNAGAVMLRVFVELSLDYFLEHTISWPAQQIANSTLAQKFTSTAHHLANVLTQGQLDYLKKVAGGQTILLASIKTMHGYVHNRDSSPLPSELKTTWNDLQIFLEKLWPR